MIPILMLFFGVAGGLFAAAEIAELVIVNANIYTVNPLQPKAKALAVRGARLSRWARRWQNMSGRRRGCWIWVGRR